MTAEEFNNEFDILYNNIMSNAAPPVNGYEKSVFLTKAQEEVVRSGYTGRPNQFNNFDLNEESRQILNPLISSYTSANLVETSTYNTFLVYRVEPPASVLFVTQESVELSDSATKLLVKPTNLDDFHKILSNPFKCPDKTKALRIEWFENSKGTYIVSKYPLKNYKSIYVRKPKPIILEALGGYTIDGESAPLSPVCELSEGIHRLIINRAVELAKSAYLGDLNTAIALNSRVQ